jgi:hypothetical protein
MEEIKRLAWLTVKRHSEPEDALYIFNAVLQTKLMHMIKFMHKPDHLIKDFDQLKKRILKTKLKLAMSYPDALLHAPLASYSAGIQPFFVYFSLTKTASILRLASMNRFMEELVKENPHISNTNISYSTNTSKRRTMELTLHCPEETLTEAVRNISEQLPHQEEGDLIIRHAHDGNTLILQIFHSSHSPGNRADRENEIFLETNFDWECDPDDHTRMALSAYLAATRIKLTNKWSGQITFQTDCLKEDLFTFKNRKKALSLNMDNSDLFLEIINTDPKTRVRIQNKEYKFMHPRRLVKLDLDGLVFPHIEHG